VRDLDELLVGEVRVDLEEERHVPVGARLDQRLARLDQQRLEPLGALQAAQAWRVEHVIFEVLEMNDEIRELIKAKASAKAYRKVMRELQIPSIRKVGFEKVRELATTVEEVMRVT